MPAELPCKTRSRNLSGDTAALPAPGAP
jgi:hypothetical protein